MIFYNLMIRILSGFICDSNKRKEFRNRYINIFRKYICYDFFKKKHYEDGNNNEIILIDGEKKYKLKKYEALKNIYIFIKGSNNTLSIVLPINNVYNSSIRFDFTDNCKIYLEKCNKLDNSLIAISYCRNALTKIKQYSTFRDSRIINNEDYCNIQIGENCRFAMSSVWSGDGHSIINNATQELLNMSPKKISIGRHCWLCEQSRIQKNGGIADNTIVGAMSLVTKEFRESNVILAGVPAKIVKNNINWDRRNPEHYKQEMQNKGEE